MAANVARVIGFSVFSGRIRIIAGDRIRPARDRNSLSEIIAGRFEDSVEGDVARERQDERIVRAESLIDPASEV